MKKPAEYQPDATFLEHFPDVSGNVVNGLGEDERRQASPFFWHAPDLQSHGDLMIETVRRLRPTDGSDPSFRNPNVDRGPELAPIAPEASVHDAPTWTQMVKDFVFSNEGDDVGIAAMKSDYVYSDFEVKARAIIIIAVQHDYDALASLTQSGGDPSSYIEMHAQYNRGARTAAKLANFIREKGHSADPWLGPTADAVLMIPAAIDAGMGELGKHGSLIHRKFGSGFRLSAVTTDIPLVADGPDTFGADEFCANCQLCTKACPPVAISDEKQMVRGTRKYYVDFDKCIPYFADNHACGICIAVCPWTRPGIADNLIVKMAKRRARS